MERRTAVAVAGGVSMILVAGALALGANLGLLGAAADGPAGKLLPTTGPGAGTPAETQVVTVEVRDPGGAAVSPAQGNSPAAPAVEIVDVSASDLRAGTAEREIEHEDGHETEGPEPAHEETPEAAETHDPEDGSEDDD